MLTGGAVDRRFRSPARAEAAQRAHELFLRGGRGRIPARGGGRLNRRLCGGSAHAVAGADECAFKNRRIRSVTSGTTSGSRQRSMVSTFGNSLATSTDTPW